MQWAQIEHADHTGSESSIGAYASLFVFSCCSSFYFHVGKFKGKKKKIKSSPPPPPHAIWTIQRSCGSYPPLGRIKVKFLPCFSFFLHLWFLGFYICDLFSFLHLWPKVFYVCDSVFFLICDIFFTYDVEFLHLAFLFFTNVAVVTFVTVFTFKVLTDVINASLIFMSCLKTVWKKVKTAQIQIAISQGLTGIFACGFLRYDPWSNAVKIVMKEQKYKSLSFELQGMKSLFWGFI